VDPMFGAVKTD